MCDLPASADKLAGKMKMIESDLNLERNALKAAINVKEM